MLWLCSSVCVVFYSVGLLFVSRLVELWNISVCRWLLRCWIEVVMLLCSVVRWVLVLVMVFSGCILLMMWKVCGKYRLVRCFLMLL